MSTAWAPVPHWEWRCCSTQACRFKGPQLGVGNFYVLYIMEIHKIGALAAAEQQQKYNVTVTKPD